MPKRQEIRKILKKVMLKNASTDCIKNLEFKKKFQKDNEEVIRNRARIQDQLKQMGYENEQTLSSLEVVKQLSKVERKCQVDSSTSEDQLFAHPIENGRQGWNIGAHLTERNTARGSGQPSSPRTATNHSSLGVKVKNGYLFRCHSA